MSMDSAMGPWQDAPNSGVGPDHPVFQAAQEVSRGKQIMQAWTDGQRESQVGPKLLGSQVPAETVKMTDQEWTDQAENYKTGQPAMEFWKQHPMPSDSEQNMGWGPRQEFPGEEWRGPKYKMDGAYGEEPTFSRERGGPIGNNKVEINLETPTEADEVRAHPPSIRYGGSQKDRMIPDEVIRAAQASQKKYNVPASVSVAQWALESGWGKRTPKGSNNPFGIKATAGQDSVAADTHEFEHGRFVPRKANFAKYANLEEAFDAHAKLLATKGAYKGAMAKADDPVSFAKSLAKRYATDPRYAYKLLTVMRKHRLIEA